MDANKVRSTISDMLRESLERAFARTEGATAQDVQLMRELLRSLTGKVEDLEDLGQVRLHGLHLVTNPPHSDTLGPVGSHVTLTTRTSRRARIHSFVLSKSTALALSPASCKVGDCELLASGGTLGIPLRSALALYHGEFIKPGVDVSITCRVERVSRIYDLRLAMLCEEYDDAGNRYPRRSVHSVVDPARIVRGGE